MSEIKVNKLSSRTGNAVTLGTSGDTFTIPAGVTLTNSGTATGFGSDTDISWQTVKTSDFTAVSGEGYFVNTTSSTITGLFCFLQFIHICLFGVILPANNTLHITCTSASLIFSLLDILCPASRILFLNASNTGVEFIAPYSFHNLNIILKYSSTI